MTGRISRRHVLQLGAAGLCATAHPVFANSALAAADMKQLQVPGFYRFMLGEFEITVLSDGSYTLPTNLFSGNISAEEIKAYLKAHLLDADQRTSHVNIPLINTGKELVLVDVGGGPNFLTGAGKLLDNLKASGYEPEDVDKIIITHGHPDHLWGLIDDFDELVFPNASYVMTSNEWTFWGTEAAKNKLPEAFQSFAAGASRRLPMIEEQTQQITPEQEIISGIFALDTPGHTPGHISLAVRSGSDSLIVTADAVTHPYISFEHPEWWPQTDADGQMAEKSRRKLLDMAVAEKSLLLTYHISYPGLGRVVQSGTAYRWLPEIWQWQL